jgi:transcriptional regulator GlxA family with amidase domain
MTAPVPHTVAAIALHDVLAFELAMPCEVFGRARVPGVSEPYRVRVCGVSERVRAGAFDVSVPFGLGQVAAADTVVLPGIADIDAPIPGEIIEALRAAHARGARLASICSGAFVLAAAGLLDGLRATTHWLAARTLAARYPAVTVDPNVLFVDNGQVLTSAGAAAGIDLCLHMVRQDHGSAVAADAARLAVVPLERSGGQAQFIVHEPPNSSASLAPLLEWMSSHLRADLDLEALARQAGTSTRTLSRRFREQTSTTPLQWVLIARIRRAQALLESTSLPVEQIATESGFETAATLRDRFCRVVGTPPSAYRRAFGGAARRSAAWQDGVQGLG